MKITFYILILLSTLSCNGQVEKRDSFQLSISPAIDTTNTENKEVLLVVENFLKTKNYSLSTNKYWLDSEFIKYIYPFADIYGIEKSKKSDNYYKPTLMELVNVEENEKLVKIGFVGYDTGTQQSIIRAVYNVIAIQNNGNWVLKRAINYQVREWNMIQKGSITYMLPKAKTASQTEIKKQTDDIVDICNFFNCSPIDITYYSCENPKQVFEVKGFDYLPNMFFSQTGGMADYGNIVYSGNNSEYYTHEIVHIYTKKLFPNISSLLDEGMATYIGGSGIYGYNWHREKMSEYFSDTTLNVAEHLNPYERLYIKNETPIPYMIGALICERVNRIYGKERLFELLRSNEDIWGILGDVGLTKENLTKELKKELKLTTTMVTDAQP
ncbi:MAG: hypothetical protein AB8B53_14500 [Flavobacteriales bacterium]